MHYVLIAIGSDGDVFPLASLGTHLSQRGHRVTLLCHGEHAAKLRCDGLECEQLTTACPHDLVSRDKALLASRYGLLHFSRHAVAWNWRIYSILRTLLSDQLVVLSSDRPNLWADALVGRAFRVPLLRLVVDLPVLPDALGHTAALPYGRLHGRLAVRYEAEWRQLVSSYGLRAGPFQIQRLSHFARISVPRVGLWPPWILGRLSSTCQIPAFGFLPAPELRMRTVDAMPFVGSGHIVFVAGTTGTTAHWSDEFFAVSIEVCRRLGRPGLLLGGATPRYAHQFGTNAMWRPFIPLAHAMKGASAIVHHGGIGTAAAALVGGIPQLIVPRVFLQPSNAEWFERLGVGMRLFPAEYRVERVLEMLARLVSDESYAARARQYAGLADPDLEAKQLCRWLEVNSGLAVSRRSFHSASITHLASSERIARSPAIPANTFGLQS